MFTFSIDLLGAGPFIIYGQEIAWGDLAIIGLLVLLEGVLSIDNALVLGLLAKRLPPEQRARALSYGLIGAFVFRVIAIATASFLLQWTFVKFLGGFYLVFIAVKHLFFEGHEEEEHKIVMDDKGNPSLVDAQTGSDLTSDQADIEIRERVPVGVSLITEEGSTTPAATTSDTRVAPKSIGKYPSFWGTVLVIELTDIAFAVDSILAAMALAGSRQSKLWVVIAGGILGVVLMRFAAALFVRLLDRFPRFEVSAYLLVIIIGCKLLADWGFNSDWSYQQSPWIASRLGSWSQTFKDIETTRRDSVHSYEQWLTTNWPLTKGAKLGHAEHHDEHHDEGHATSNSNASNVVEGQAQPTETEAVKKEVSVPHIPHLLDFHDLRRPECLSFWLAMAVCFGIGFIPRNRSSLDT